MAKKQQKQRKVPQRLCLGCQESHPKKELLRIVRSKEGEFSVDPTGKKPGHGAYICRKRSCFEAARKNHGLERAFQTKIDASIYEMLGAEVARIEAESADAQGEA